MADIVGTIGTNRHRLGSLGLVIVAALTLLGCDGETDDGIDPETGTDEDRSEVGESRSEAEAPPPSANDDGETTTSPEASDPNQEAGNSQAAPLETQASTDDRTQDPGPGALAVSEVRVGSHDGFDRVTFELDGDGSAGWGLFLVDEARAQGSGAQIDLQGDAALEVQIRGVTLPPELPADVSVYDGPATITGPDGGVVLEVVEDTIFEGYHTFFIGLEERRPFRVDRLEEPQRVVVDILH